MLRCLFDTQNPSKRCGTCRNHQNCSCFAACGQQNFWQPFPSQCAVNKEANDQGISACHCRNFCGRENAHSKPNQNQNRHGQRPQRLFECMPKPLPAESSIFWKTTPMCSDCNHQHHRQGHDQTWNKAGNKQIAQRNVRLPSVNHHQNRWRNNWSQGGCSSANSSSEALPVARLR